MDFSWSRSDIMCTEKDLSTINPWKDWWSTGLWCWSSEYFVLSERRTDNKQFWIPNPSPSPCLVIQSGRSGNTECLLKEKKFRATDPRYRGEMWEIIYRNKLSYLLLVASSFVVILPTTPSHKNQEQMYVSWERQTLWRVWSNLAVWKSSPCINILQHYMVHEGQTCYRLQNRN